MWYSARVQEVAELGQRSAGVCCLTLVCLSMVCWELWGCGQAGSVPARQAVEMAFYLLFFLCLVSCPRVPFAEGGGLMRAPRGRSVTLRNGHGVISASLLFWIEQPRAWQALNCRAVFCCGQTLTIHIPLSAELGPHTTDTELPEAADLDHQ